MTAASSSHQAICVLIRSGPLGLLVVMFFSPLKDQDDIVEQVPLMRARLQL